MLRFSQFALIAISVAFVTASASRAQTPAHKHLSPGEMAAADREKAEKTAACRAQAKKQKIALMKRRAFVKDCVAKQP